MGQWARIDPSAVPHPPYLSHTRFSPKRRHIAMKINALSSQAKLSRSLYPHSTYGAPSSPSPICLPLSCAQPYACMHQHNHPQWGQSRSSPASLTLTPLRAPRPRSLGPRRAAEAPVPPCGQQRIGHRQAESKCLPTLGNGSGGLTGNRYAGSTGYPQGTPRGLAVGWAWQPRPNE